MKSTVGQIIMRAVTESNATLMGKIAEVCRFKFSMNYDQTYDFVNGICRISKADFENLMYLSDMQS